MFGVAIPVWMVRYNVHRLSGRINNGCAQNTILTVPDIALIKVFRYIRSEIDLPQGCGLLGVIRIEGIDVIVACGDKDNVVGSFVWNTPVSVIKGLGINITNDLPGRKFAKPLLYYHRFS